MRRLTVQASTATLLVLALGALPAQARNHGSGRGLDGTYSSPGGAWVSVPDAEVAIVSASCADARGCVAFPIPTGANSVEIEIIDQSGMTAMGVVTGVADESSSQVCGTTTDPLMLIDEIDGEPVNEIQVVLISGTCRDGTPSVVTSGEVIATFSTSKG